MPPKNPNDSDPETRVAFLPSGPTAKAHRHPELQNPISSDRKGVVLSAWREQSSTSTTAASTSKDKGRDISCGRERLKRHRVEVAGRVRIPEMWGQEDFLKDWIDCTAFDATLRKSSIMSARAALVEEGKRANSTRISIQNSC